MRYGIGECLQFPIGGLELGSSLFKFCVERVNLTIAPITLGDVVVRLQNRNCLPRPSRRKDQRLATTTGVPSALVCSSSPSQRPLVSSSALTSASGGMAPIERSLRCNAPEESHL
jgi:hypothetical protein